MDDNNFNGIVNVGVEKYSYDLKFGYGRDKKKEVYDKNTDKYAPPPPPGNFFDAALGVDGERYYSKIVGCSDEEIVFSIFIQMGDNNKIYLKWDNTKWSETLKSCVLQDAYDGRIGINVDMLKQNNFEITDSILNVVRLKIQKK